MTPGVPAVPASGPPAPPASVVATWSASWSLPLTTAVPDTLSLPVTVSNNPGHWMIAIVTWRQFEGGAGSTITVGDDAHNWWDPMGKSPITSNAAGVTRTTVWMAPAARAATTVMVAPTGPVLAICALIVEVAGLTPWPSRLTASGQYANAATSLPSMTVTGASQSLIVTGCGSDLNTATITQSGTGWSSLPTVTTSDGSDHLEDLTLTPYLQLATSATSTFHSSASCDLSGCTAGTLVAATAPVSQSPYWPATIFEMAPGSGVQTPPDLVTWTPVTAQSLKLSGLTQGRQYETAQLSAGEGTLYLDNPLGNAIPPGTGSLAGIDSGTPVRLRCAWSGGSWQVQLAGNGTTASPQMETGATWSVTPGQAYSVAAWLGCSATYSAGLTLAIQWKTSGGVVISQSASPAVTGITAVMATASGYAPSSAALATAVIAAAGTPASSAVFYAAAVPAASSAAVTTLRGQYLTIPPAVTWTAENGATVTKLTTRFQADPAGPPDLTPWYVPYSGFVERLPQAWDDLLRGFTEAAVTDAWFGCNYTPQPILLTEILNDQPYAYWPCTDPATATQASNVAPSNPNPLLVTPSSYGGGIGTTQAFGQNGDALLGALQTLVVSAALQVSNQAGMWGLTLGGSVSAFQGYGLTAVDSNFPQAAGGLTIEGWFQPASGQSGRLIELSAVTGVSNGYITFTTGGFLDVAGSIGCGQFTPGDLFHFAITITNSAWATYLNGVNTASGSGALLNGFSQIQVNGNPLDTLPSDFWNGYAAHLAIFPSVLPASRILTHYRAGLFAMSGEGTSNRYERLLQAGNATGRRVILHETGFNVTPVVSCQDIPGQPASASLSNIAGSVLPGLLYVAPTGDLFGLSKQAAYNQPVKWVVGDDPYQGEYPYLGDINFDYDPSRVQNQIQLTQLDNQDIIAPSVTAIENASQAQYGTISNQSTGYVQGDATVELGFGPGLYDLADWLATGFAKPRLRLTKVTIDAARYPAAWPLILGGSVGDVVQANRRPIGDGTPLISVTGRVSQTERNFEFSVGAVSGSLDLIIDPAPELNCLTADQTTLGTLNGVNSLGW